MVSTRSLLRLGSVLVLLVTFAGCGERPGARSGDSGAATPGGRAGATPNAPNSLRGGQATIGVVWVSMPLMLLGFALPSVGAMGVLFASGLGAVASAPLMAMVTTRAPHQLRAKVMTATITIVTISGPFAVIALGRLLESFDVRTILFALGVGRILMAAMFLVVVRRAGAAMPQPEQAVA